MCERGIVHIRDDQAFNADLIENIETQKSKKFDTNLKFRITGGVTKFAWFDTEFGTKNHCFHFIIFLISLGYYLSSILVYTNKQQLLK